MYYSSSWTMASFHDDDDNDDDVDGTIARCTVQMWRQSILKMLCLNKQTKCVTKKQENCKQGPT